MSNFGFRKISAWCETPPGSTKEVECACVPIHNASKLFNLPIDPDLETTCVEGDILIWNGTEWECDGPVNLTGVTGPTGPCNPPQELFFQGFQPSAGPGLTGPPGQGAWSTIQYTIDTQSATPIYVDTAPTHIVIPTGGAGLYNLSISGAMSSSGGFNLMQVAIFLRPGGAGNATTFVGSRGPDLDLSGQFSGSSVSGFRFLEEGDEVYFGYISNTDLKVGNLIDGNTSKLTMAQAYLVRKEVP